MISIFYSLAFLFGRLLFSLVFFYSAFYKIVHFNQTVALFDSYHLGFAPVLVIASIVTEALGATLFLAYSKIRMAAVLLLCVWVPYTLVQFPFWTYTLYSAQMKQFLFHSGLIGALFLLISQGKGQANG